MANDARPFHNQLINSSQSFGGSQQRTRRTGQCSVCLRILSLTNAGRHSPTWSWMPRYWSSPCWWGQ